MPSDQENIEELMRQVKRQGELIEGLYRHLGLGQLAAASAGDPPADVVEALRAGNTIVAIKLWRDRTGAGLKEAKDAVEELARSMGL